MDTRKPTLLIVDDLPDNRAILSRRFSRTGFLVEEADGGAGALELIAQSRFDAVLLDIVMPDIDGLEVLTRIRHTYTASCLPVIMVTAKAEDADVAQALSLGANDYLTKPVNFNVALARVKAQIARKHAEEALEQNLRELQETNQRLEAEIAERKASQARVHHLVRHDDLTGLGNRVVLREKLTRVLTEGRRASLLFIDIDNFKSINETLGHGLGDEILQAVACRLVDCAGPSDTVVRWAANQFAILALDATGPDGAANLATHVADCIGAPDQVNEHKWVLSCSIGIALAPADGNDPNTLLRSAEMALTKAKASARGKWRFFEPEMNARAQARRALELDLRNALTTGQLDLNFQPLMHLQQGVITAFEALVRWNHPERGMISPAEFIPIAECGGLITLLGRWVLHRACAEAVKWPSDLKVAVNVSAAQFKAGRLGDEVFIALAASGLQANRLEIEITETALLEEDESTIATLHHLRSMGVRISMDDFGTGYSSLSYLRSFPFDKIKIDQSFVRNLDKDPQNIAIVRAVTGMAKSLKIVATAEGVETQEQLELLRAEGCTEVQGFLISRPLPVAGIGSFLADRSHTKRDARGWRAAAPE